MKYLVVEDVPTPWRDRVLECVHKQLKDEFHVVYCHDREQRRLWQFTPGAHSKTFLKKTVHIRWRGKEKYLNLGIIPFLLKYKPKAIICESFNPTTLLTFAIAKILKIKTAFIGDTWLKRDEKISWHHKLMRKAVFNVFAEAYIGASEETLKWYKFYNNNIPEESLFISSLCADNDYFTSYLKRSNVEKHYDIMFSGRIVKEKNPLFLAEVACKIRQKRGNCRLLIIGEGDVEIKRKMFQRFNEKGVEYDFPGFIEHSRLPGFYSQAKILLLPTSGDCWGVVINEALVCGVPVITTDMTAAAGELVLHGRNGYVLPLEPETWAERICFLLENEEKYKQFSECAKEMVGRFTFERAAQGIIGAFEYLDNLGLKNKSREMDYRKGGEWIR